LQKCGSLALSQYCKDGIDIMKLDIEGGKKDVRAAKIKR
jgi:hypothetical protein